MDISDAGHSIASGGDVDVTVAARLFRGFSDPTRLSILLALVDGERRVTDLIEEVGTSQANVSGHLACLRDCGLVRSRPEGRQVFYRLAGPEILELLRAAECVLEVAGHQIELCPNTSPPAAAQSRAALATATTA